MNKERAPPVQRYAIESELQRFAGFTSLRSRDFSVESPCEHAVLLKPAGAASAFRKTITLTFAGIVHGNELAGLAVMNELFALLHAGVLRLEIPLALVLGNPEAARENKRFLDRDLNRSFASSSTPAGPFGREERRAKELEGVLRETAFFVDFHQVSRPSDRPFFIFPYNPQSFAFARAIAPRQTIVTHWGEPFSVEGMCSDEFVNACGGTGVSLELGQNGFDPYQIAVGVNCALGAIGAVTAIVKGLPTPQSAIDPGEVGELYTWADIMPWPEDGTVELDEGWSNFDEVAAGQRLGVVDGRFLTARVAGKMLFPKYLTRAQQSLQRSRPSELCRIMKPINEEAFPR